MMNEMMDRERKIVAEIEKHNEELLKKAKEKKEKGEKK